MVPGSAAAPVMSASQKDYHKEQKRTKDPPKHTGLSETGQEAGQATTTKGGRSTCISIEGAAAGQQTQQAQLANPSTAA